MSDPSSNSSLNRTWTRNSAACQCYDRTRAGPRRLDWIRYALSRMTIDIKPSFGDNVRIRTTPETERAGLAGKSGSVSGFTTPSVTAIVPIGSPSEDYAIAVMFDDGPVRDAWFAEDLVEFVDHAEGTEIRIGNMKAVRSADGGWVESRLDGTPIGSDRIEGPSRSWWKFW